ncbi:hypothetical protein HIM_01616 [Hirsutella minnesotensis 3608]|nr:hypothetical protein HIM_01616 [Hirsutella minnesotensis 3608]
MGDSEEKPAQADSAQQQQQPSHPDEQPAAADSPAEPDQLEVARRFLDDDEVRGASRHKKVQFLKSKGIQDDDIQKLLQEPQNDISSDTAATVPSVSREQEAAPRALPPPTPEGDRPPVVTYPEFLAKPARPPPLVTTNGLLATLYGFAGASTLVYGASKLVLAPMVDSLTDARSDLHATAAHKLGALVAKLERTVSEIPPAAAGPPRADDLSDAEDPTEMFHRDAGRLAEAAKTLASLKDHLRAQSQDLEDVRTLLDVFRDDVDGLTYGTQAQYVGGYDRYGSIKRAEPEDEIRKVRDNIRRIKGVLLSTRSFPASTR